MGDSATPHINRWYDLISNHQAVRSAVARMPKQEVVKETVPRGDVSVVPTLTKPNTPHTPTEYRTPLPTCVVEQGAQCVLGCIMR